MAGQVYLLNPTITNIKLKINDDKVDETGARFLAKTSKEMGWIPQTSAEAVDRSDEAAPNTLGYGNNVFYIYRDMTLDRRLDDLAKQPLPEWRMKRLRVRIRPEVSQLEEDLVLYVVFDGDNYGYILLDREGHTKEYQQPQRYVESST